MRYEYERPTADPTMVAQLLHGMHEGMDAAAIPGVTTSADVLSAVLTMLSRLLELVREAEDPADRAANADEINRVLMNLMFQTKTQKAH